MATTKKKATMRVQQYKSAIGYNKKQREVLKGLGIRRMQHIVEVEDTDATRGMVNKISHLVKILDEA
jgi:large subunit ribosomal protein L30